MLVVLAEGLNSFLPDMIDVRCTNVLINLWLMNGELRLLCFVFVTNSVSHVIANSQ